MSRIAFAPILVLAAQFLFSHGIRAETTRTQQLFLEPGWNAVFLEVYPLNNEPAIVFSGKPVDVVASYYPAASPAQFTADPAAEMYKKTGWGVWYTPKRPDAFLTTLFAIFGQQAYLVHATSACTLEVSGGIVLPSIKWQANAYNLVGFSLPPTGTPTFAQFFSGSPAHRHNKIYRLVQGVWQQVLDPASQTMRSGEAFWIYCDGASSYQGPLQVETRIAQGLFLGDSGKDSLRLRNQTGHPVSVTLEHVPAGPGGLPLSFVIQALGDASAPVQSVSAPLPYGAWTQVLPPLEGGDSVQVPFEVRVEELTAGMQSTLLKVTTDLGTEVWVPVISGRKDLEND